MEGRSGALKVLEAGWELVSSRSIGDTVLWVSDSTTFKQGLGQGSSIERLEVSVTHLAP